jgi:hypothetical protein
MAPIPEVPVNDKVLHFFGVSIQRQLVAYCRSASFWPVGVQSVWLTLECVYRWESQRSSSIS